MNFEFIIEIVCVSFCALHFLISLISGLVQNKKIKKLCEKCYQPVFEDEVHKCLDDNQILKLVEFVSSLKVDKDGN